MRIAPLAEADAAPYRALMLHAYAAVPDAYTSTVQERQAEPLEWWVARIAHPQGLSLAIGAWLGDALAGTVALEFSAKPKTRHKAHLIGMFVAEAARGQGLGRALVDAALAEASARPEVRVVTLTFTEGNEAARRLYEACGFRAFGTEPMAIATPAGLLAKVHMTLALPARCDPSTPGGTGCRYPAP